MNDGTRAPLLVALPQQTGPNLLKTREEVIRHKVSYQT